MLSKVSGKAAPSEGGKFQKKFSVVKTKCSYATCLIKCIKREVQQQSRFTDH